ncbi:peptidyl-prolyl cis-trans isomerase-like 4 isoform X2 [Cotesia typhae]|uniref:peptidyl-prolyl cis-trans isomerase-like 4 isoform X2 n=1 Tax=Cotesia typhae TaxID=2053667 RepID=UPI003D680E6A
MSVVIETTIGDFTVDLFTNERPQTCRNFLKLCKIKYYNWSLFHTVEREFIAQTGDPTGTGKGGESVYGMVLGEKARYYEAEQMPKIKHDQAICDDVGHRPLQDIRISHTVILEDPYDDPKGLEIPDRSPGPTEECLKSDRIGADEAIDDTAGMTEEEIIEMRKNKEAKAAATILEIVGDIPDADIAPPENVLFVCKLHPDTSDDDLEIIFGRFGQIIGCEVIRDHKTGDSLQYAFIEYADRKSCEDAYFKMNNVLIDDRRIKVDFSQSVAKMRWRGKGKGILHLNDNQAQNRNSKDDRKRPRSRSRERTERKRSRSRGRNERKRSKSRERRDRRRSRSRDRKVRQERRRSKERERNERRERSRSRERKDRRRSRSKDRRNKYDHKKHR